MLHIHGARGEGHGLLEMVTKEHNKGCKHIGLLFKVEVVFPKRIARKIHNIVSQSFQKTIYYMLKCILINKFIHHLNAKSILCTMIFDQYEHMLSIDIRQY
jgi:lauroyl/myristoyl acyltransferase